MGVHLVFPSVDPAGPRGRSSTEVTSFRAETTNKGPKKRQKDATGPQTSDEHAVEPIQSAMMDFQLNINPAERAARRGEGAAQKKSTTAAPVLSRFPPSAP